MRPAEPPSAPSVGDIGSDYLHRAGPGRPSSGRGSGGIYVTEMITSRALVERNADTMDMIRTDPDESPRSVQLYGVDPGVVAAAVHMLVTEDRADHIDLNFGCPVAKVTRKGGGAALPWKRGLFREIVRRAVSAADGRVPVTVKMRIGIDEDHQTYLAAGEIAAQEGAAWVSLHGRTAAQLYGGKADRSAIARLVEHLAPYDLPVLGNGDIWTAQDALDMVSETGCHGVVVGRGCLGRPWLFGQLVAAFAGRPIPSDPGLREVAQTMRRHAELLVEIAGPDKGPRDFRKHIAWYLKGFSAPREIRQGLAMVSSLAEIDAWLAQLDLDQPFNVEVAAGPRGRTTPKQKVALPYGWLDDPDDLNGFLAELGHAELSVSGG
jgi:nifR3 family TIM-barrel protein